MMVLLMVERLLKNIPDEKAEPRFRRLRELLQDAADNSRFKSSELEHVERVKKLVDTYLLTVTSTWADRCREIVKGL